jgi:hypothetical protein
LALKGGFSPADARAYAVADSLLAQGMPLERVAEAMKDVEGWEPDTRTAAQRRHDAEHGMPLAVDPRGYYAPLPLPPGAEMSPGDRALDTDVKNLAAGLCLSPDAGASFINTVYRAAQELANAPDPAALRETWNQTLAAVFPGEKLAEAERQIDELLKDFGGDNPLIAKLRESGVIRSPLLLMALRNRALRLEAWRSTRPE